MGEMFGSPYLIPADTHRVQETIRRSRFITTVAHAPESDVAHEFVRQTRDEFHDATHHCWAFVSGPPGVTTSVGLSDDGEPHGTAGRPMLTVLLHSGIGEIVAVCTRYYGGVKLGTGGLSRAYASGVKLALESMTTQPKIDRIVAVVSVAYESADAVQRLMKEMHVAVSGEDYGSSVRYECGIPAASFERFTSAVADMTRGAGSVEQIQPPVGPSTDSP